MAQRVHVVLIDDLDQSEAAETVAFALDGVSYEIDLSSGNADRMRDDLARWIGSARRTGGRKVAATRTAAKADLAKVREWARAEGLKVSDRGRISATVQQAYDRAHG